MLVKEEEEEEGEGDWGGRCEGKWEYEWEGDEENLQQYHNWLGPASPEKKLEYQQKKHIKWKKIRISTKKT